MLKLGFSSQSSVDMDDVDDDSGSLDLIVEAEGDDDASDTTADDAVLLARAVAPSDAASLALLSPAFSDFVEFVVVDASRACVKRGYCSPERLWQQSAELVKDGRFS